MIRVRRPIPPSDRTVLTAQGRDAGLSLMEMLVTMVVLGVFLALFSTTLLSLVRSVQRQTGTIDAQQATANAFLILDKQFRYASAVTTPATISGVQWIEWQVPDPKILITQSATQSRCYQWQASASAGTLKFRSWVVPTTGSVSTPPWQSVASGLVIGSVPVFTTTTAGLQAAPFSLPSASSAASLSYAQLGVALTSQGGNTAGRAAASTVFTALNSSSTPANVCTEVPRS